MPFFSPFSVGFYAYAIAEYLLVNRLVRSRALLYLFPLFSILSLAAVYEMFEWIYAVSADARIRIYSRSSRYWELTREKSLDLCAKVEVRT